MTLQEFFNQYDGKSVDYDSYYGPQCVDLVQFYNRDVIGAPRLTGNAADIWSSFPHDFYDAIPNGPDNFPSPGDIVIWNTKVGGGAGHIAICRDATKDNFTSFDQNWPTGSPSHFQPHTYTNVFGWLHPKQAAQPATVAVPSDTFSTLVDKATRYDAFAAAGYPEIQTVLDKLMADQQQIAQLNKSILTLNEKISDMAKVVDADARNDYDLGVENKELSEERDGVQAVLDTVCDSLGLPRTRFSINADYSYLWDKLKALQTPADEVVKPVLQERNELYKLVFEDFIYKKLPKTQPLLTRIVNWFGGVMHT